MQVTREELNPCTIKLSIVASEDLVRQGFDRAYKQASRDVRIPGFRPGAAPKHLVKQRATNDPGLMNSIMEFARDHIVNKAYQEALVSEKLEPSGNGAVDVTAFDEESAKTEFVVKVPLAPQVELGEYIGIEVEKPDDTVTDEDVKGYIEEMRKRKGSREEVTSRGAEEGDVAVVNIRLDGEAKDDRSFMVIIGKTFAALDDTLKSMNVEEMRSVDLKFPKTFQEKDWAGKSHHCTVTLRSLSTVSMPELDDEFAKTMKAENVAELETKVRTVLERAKKDAIQEYVNERLLDALLAKSTVHVPDNMWEVVANRKLQDIYQEQGRQGKTVEDYAKENGMTVEELVKAQTEEAQLYVKRAVMVQRIYGDEKMKLTDQELNIELFEMANEFQVPPQDLLTALRKNKALDDLVFRATYKKVTKFLNENAKFA